MADPCGLVYMRPQEFGGAVMACTYVENHPTAHHSWYALQVQDAYDLQAAATAMQSTIPDDVQAILDNIEEGRADPYLEVILAVTHDRKRTLRGTRGFPRLSRTERK